MTLDEINALYDVPADEAETDDAPVVRVYATELESVPSFEGEDGEAPFYPRAGASAPAPRPSNPFATEPVMIRTLLGFTVRPETLLGTKGLSAYDAAGAWRYWAGASSWAQWAREFRVWARDTGARP